MQATMQAFSEKRDACGVLGSSGYTGMFAGFVLFILNKYFLLFFLFHIASFPLILVGYSYHWPSSRRGADFSRSLQTFLLNHPMLDV